MVGEGGEMNEGEGRRVFGRGECILFGFDIMVSGKSGTMPERDVWRGGGRNVQQQKSGKGSRKWKVGAVKTTCERWEEVWSGSTLNLGM